LAHLLAFLSTWCDARRDGATASPHRSLPDACNLVPVTADGPSRPPLAADALPEAVRSRWRVEVVERSPSTNAAVSERARAGEPDGLVLVAEHQTAGRGRLDRSWVTPPRAALTLSLLVAPHEVLPARWPWLPLLTGLAVTDALAAVGVAADLKWPNDVLLADRKLAGILVERVERRPEAVAVVGIGLNVSTTSAELPVPTATSLALAGADVDRTRLLGHVLDAFAERYDAWRAASGTGPLTAYAARCSTIGRRVRVDLPGGEPLEGEAVGVDEGGRLEVDDGRRVHVLGAGDVVHVRASEAPG
jgi:BirA family biotin operon repressor/biotin-[acetyl-CoA-carboxylase] ligase